VVVDAIDHVHLGVIFLDTEGERDLDPDLLVTLDATG
jgi:hypothetical protein